MKQKFILLMTLIAAVIAFSGCSSDNDNFGDSPAKTYSEVGVWTSGNYFISLSSEHFLTAYIAPGFLDCGQYARSGNAITSNNNYFAKSSVYNIKSIDDKTMKVEISYTDISGNTKTTTLELSKSDKAPVEKDNPLVGKSYSWKELYGTATMSFNTYDTGMLTSTWKNYADYPLTVYYIYFDGYVYYQEFSPAGRQMPTIGGWGNRTDDGEIIVSKVTFGNDGSIIDFTNAEKEKL